MLIEIHQKDSPLTGKCECSSCIKNTIESKDCAHAFVIYALCKKENKKSERYKRKAEKFEEIDSDVARDTSIEYHSKSFEAMDSGIVYWCVTCGLKKQEYK